MPQSLPTLWLLLPVEFIIWQKLPRPKGGGDFEVVDRKSSKHRVIMNARRHGCLALLLQGQVIFERGGGAGGATSGSS